MLRFNPVVRALPLRGAPVSRQIYRSPLRQAFKRFQSTAGASNQAPSPKPKGIKALMKEYGYSALGVYLGLSLIDLPLCYLLVHSMGREEIEHYENKVKQAFGFGVSEAELRTKQAISKIEEQVEAGDNEENSHQSTFSYLLSQFSWAEFALAYGIHKSFIFVRLPLTAAITPTIVRVLRRWGFKLGTDKLATSAALAKTQIKDYSAANPKFGTRATNKRKWFSWFF